tara:strand:+ start:329 stop:538 length:210 start_codon:yes stop_codon:yes gene_type:complete
MEFENIPDDGLPYVQLDLDIMDVRVIYESILYQSENNKDMSEDKKVRVEAMRNFFSRVILEYNYSVEDS